MQFTIYMSFIPNHSQDNTIMSLALPVSTQNNDQTYTHDFSENCFSDKVHRQSSAKKAPCKNTSSNNTFHTFHHFYLRYP